MTATWSLPRKIIQPDPQSHEFGCINRPFIISEICSLRLQISETAVHVQSSQNQNRFDWGRELIYVRLGKLSRPQAADLLREAVQKKKEKLALGRLAAREAHQRLKTSWAVKGYHKAT